MVDPGLMAVIEEMFIFVKFVRRGGSKPITPTLLPK